jgi:hypothetical protein
MQSNKRGKQSGAEKQDGTRYGLRPVPATAPQHGAYGRRDDTAGDVGSEETVLPNDDPVLVEDEEV